MFTADNARSGRNPFDRQIEKLVCEAFPDQKSHYKVYWEDGRMEERAKRVAELLRERGFTVTGIEDLGSYRFAEVHFTWEAP